MKNGSQWKEATVWLLSEKINKPPFRHISPMVYWSGWAFSGINMFFLAPAFFVAHSNTGLPLVNLVPSVVWGCIFLSIGIVMVTGLLKNIWPLIKFMMIAGLMVKAAFAWALTLTLFVSVQSIGVVGVWLGMMVWQALCLIYFTPEMKNVSDI